MDRLVKTEAERNLAKEKILSLKRVNLTDRALFDLELIMSGGFYPLEGFLNEEDYKSVVEKMRLKSGDLWPMPIVLDLSEEFVKELALGEEIVLCDKFGNPLALMEVSSIYKPDKEREARMVLGTTDLAHPSVRYLFREMKDYYVGGKISGLAYSPKYDFKELRRTPAELKQYFKDKGIDKVVAFQTRNPTHRAHYEIMMRSSADAGGAHILIHPVVGVTKEGDVDYITRVRAYKRLHENHMKDSATLSLLPLAMRMAGPREALWHALIRKNHGVTHFIVGRDHAGPGNDSSGKPFYGPFDAQELAKKYEDEIGLKIICQPEMVYVEELNSYVPQGEVKEGHTVKNISGTKFRSMLANREDVPEWFSFKEVIEELQKGVDPLNKKGVTIFFTGLSGAGKSTIANVLATKLLEIQDRKITLLDGDVVRQNLSKGLGFSKEDRNTNIERIGFVANEITRHGGMAICSAIAPYNDARERNRDLISKNGEYIEVYVSTPFEICKERDVKGLYKKAAKGLIKGFTGESDPYEVPENPEIVCDTTKYDAEKCADDIIDYLKNHKLI